MHETAAAARITELEIRGAYQEDTIAQLNDALISQQRQIDSLVARINALEEQVERATEQGQQGTPYRSDEERPPHY